jgi:hypothetical protein
VSGSDPSHEGTPGEADAREIESDATPSDPEPAAAEAPPPASAASAEEVQRDVEACIRALYGGDLDTVLRYTHPMILAAMGGPKGAREVLEPTLERMRESGMTIESFSFPSPPDFVDSGGRVFAIVPTLMVLSTNGQRVESRNFQLGILEPDAEGWAFVEGSRVNASTVRQLFPDFPAGYAFPPVSREKL